MPDPSLSERIRTIFLHERPHVSISDAADLLGWSRTEMNQALAAQEIDVTAACSGKAIAIEEVAAKALELWPLETIEDALGKDAALVLPADVRTRKVVAHLPRYQVQMLVHLAAARDTTVGHLLSLSLDDLASEHLQELDATIPGFADAFHWPHAETGQQPS